MWVYNPQPVKLDVYKKKILQERVQKFIDSSKRLSKIVNRIDIRSGRIYLFYLFEPYIPEASEGVHFIKPLIDGKYLELNFARITMYDKEFSKCSADWKRDNDQWMSLFNGTLDNCLKFIQDDEEWFSV